MKAGREALWLPLNGPAARRPGPALDQLEEAVPRVDVPPAVSFENNGRSRLADAGINDTQEDGSGREPSGIGRQQVGCCFGIADWGIGEGSITGTPGAVW